MGSDSSAIDFQEIHCRNQIKAEELIKRWVIVKGKIQYMHRETPISNEASIIIEPLWAPYGSIVSSHCEFNKGSESWSKIAEVINGEEITIRGYCDLGLAYKEPKPYSDLPWGYSIQLTNCEIVDPWFDLIQRFFRFFGLNP